MQAPATPVALTNSKNKIELDATEGILDPGYFNEATQTYTLTIAGVRDVLVDITGGLWIDRHDLRSTHEEADILIAQHAISLSLVGKCVRVVCDDTYFFVLLVHYYNSRCKCSNSVPIIMSSPVKERAVIYIRATVESHSDIADDLLAIHGLSGADAVASLHDIGKKGCFRLFCIGDVHAEIKSVEEQVTKFMCAAYGKAAESCNSMTECRVKMWRLNTGKSSSSSVKLCSIPPTTESSTENVHRCQRQVAIRRAALLESPLEMDSTKYAWELDHLGNLFPRTVPSGTLSAPPDILQLIHCNWNASGCRTAACSCTKIGCTIFCLCESAEACKNPRTRSQTEDPSEKTIEDPDDDDM